MPIIDSSSDSKFDALVRTNKAGALMSFIMATSTVKSQNDRKKQIAIHLKSAYELFRENIMGTNSGAGSYGDGSRDILEQFESHYTMGYEMGIWIDGDFNLNPLAQKVAKYEITVSEYIGVVFLNLFSFYNNGAKDVYHHYLYEILSKVTSSTSFSEDISKELIAETLPIKKATEQANIIFNYLSATDLFVKTSKNTMRIADKWNKKGVNLKSLCNLEYQNMTREEANDKFGDKKVYANYVTKLPNIDEEVEFIGHDLDTVDRIAGGSNSLLYGVPGSGKSWAIQNEYCSDESAIERIVFHPDYTYSDFVGQILPSVFEDGSVVYQFTPGPFTTLLKDAYEHPNNEYFLIIEEINRGNAPAIFGEIFQLLDRKTKIIPNDDGYTIGTSEYGITNADISKIVYGDPKHKVRIPSNMSIIGTMNTSDQNVFTLDTAFQRRWDMRLIENTFNLSDQDLANMKILDTTVTWRTFFESINEIILDKNVRMTSSEDKRLGKHFVRISELEFNNGNDSKAQLSNRKFPEKVIKYLWDDAFKFSREDIFEVGKYNSLESVIRYFVNTRGDERFDIFKENIINTIIPNPNVQSIVNTQVSD